LVLLPAFISSAGALGGILSSRLATKLHLGLLEARAVPSREARLDGASVFLLGAPVFLFNAVGAHLTAALLHEASPGLLDVVAASMLGGAVAVAFVVAVAYYGTVASFRLGLDPDTYGVPVVTSSVDFLGAVALIVTIVALGIA
jgi:mgtE-like transporter